MPSRLNDKGEETEDPGKSPVTLTELLSRGNGQTNEAWLSQTVEASPLRPRRRPMLGRLKDIWARGLMASGRGVEPPYCERLADIHGKQGSRYAGFRRIFFGASPGGCARG